MALIDETAGTLDYLGLGNVHAQVDKASPPVRPANHNGTVGSSLRALRNYRAFQYPWSPGNLLVMATDGIS